MEDKSFYVYALLDSRHSGFFEYNVNGKKIFLTMNLFILGKEVLHLKADR